MRSLLQALFLISALLLTTSSIASSNDEQQFIADSKQLIKALASDL